MMSFGGKISSSPTLMMTSSNGNIFRVTGHLCGEFTGEFPAQRPVTRSFDVFCGLRLNKRLSKQSWGWCFRCYPSHYDVRVMLPPHPTPPPWKKFSKITAHNFICNFIINFDIVSLKSVNRPGYRWSQHCLGQWLPKTMNTQFSDAYIQHKVEAS